MNKSITDKVNCVVNKQIKSLNVMLITKRKINELKNKNYLYLQAWGLS